MKRALMKMERLDLVQNEEFCQLLEKDCKNRKAKNFVYSDQDTEVLTTKPVFTMEVRVAKINTIWQKGN